MKKLVVGILAHVDAGKTTLSEAMLYLSGSIKKLGRVDHGNSFLDTYSLERERGITIFSKQAIISLKDMEITLLDTPGHVDFSGEMERTLQVLDYAILVVSGSDGVQSHTLTVWKLLRRYRIPTFMFVNKMDLSGTDRARTMDELKRLFGESCVMFGSGWEGFAEQIALTEEALLDRYLAGEMFEADDIARLISERKVFPCYFGSALKAEGVAEFLDGLEQYTRCPKYPDRFGARVYKITRDGQGNRLTFMKITGGSLKVKTPLTYESQTGTDGKPNGGNGMLEEKPDQIRIYSGEKYRVVDEAPAGTVCAVTGLTKTYPGQGLGAESSFAAPVLEPVLTYKVLLPDNCDVHGMYLKLKQLEEEDPLLRVAWDDRLKEIRLQLMGEVQMEVLSRLIRERFGVDVDFASGGILYKETIEEPVIGVGHFEPLRHYAEVHLLLEPGERGTGLVFGSSVSEDELDKNWQRLILTHLAEKEHVGVLTGSPITDMKITLVAGRAHLKHTEGGDFRQATYRAVRQGLMKARSILLEPYYEFRIELPSETVGRAMSDIRQRHGTFLPPETVGGISVLQGSAPVSTMRDYIAELTSYTRGRGRMFCTFGGYRPCHNAEDVIRSIGYDNESDLENPADSVFCSNGAGFIVKWDQVQDYMHLDSGIILNNTSDNIPASDNPPESADNSSGDNTSGKLKKSRSPSSYSGSLREDEELMAIFERTYGEIRRRDFFPRSPVRSAEDNDGSAHTSEPASEFLLVDGYNIIFAWDDLKALAQESLDAARNSLIHILSNYQGYKKTGLILVFDAYKVKDGVGSVEKINDIYVVYTREAETADMYIERVTYEIGKKHRIRVATSDNLEQLIILGNNASRISASAFREEVERVNAEIAEIIRAQGTK